MKKLCTIAASRASKGMWLTIMAAIFICSGPDLKAGESLETSRSVDKKSGNTPYQAEEMIVTAQKRKENVQDIPDSITVLNEI